MLKQFSDAVVNRKIEAWQNYLARGQVQVVHIWQTLHTWKHYGLINEKQYKKMLRHF